MSDLPADWAIEKAREVMGLSTYYVAGATFSAGILAFARYIEAHEKPPVDRKLLCVREAAARIKERRGKAALAASIRAGEFDHELGDMIDAITLWEDGFGKAPETTVLQCQ